MTNKPLPTGKTWYTTGDLIAAGYGSRVTIIRDIEDGEFPAIQLKSGRYLIPCETFLEYIDSRKVSPAEAGE